jgi:hypothetical protein
MTMKRNSDSRRQFLKKSAYVVPAILSLNVALVEARAASMDEDRGRGRSGPRGQRDDKTRDTRDSRDLTR